jgi:hypothetical protein
MTASFETKDINVILNAILLSDKRKNHSKSVAAAAILDFEKNKFFLLVNSGLPDTLAPKS